MSQSTVLDYSLTGVNATAAVEKGLAEADWYTSPVEKTTMRKLLQRRNGPAIRDTILLIVLLLCATIAAQSATLDPRHESHHAPGHCCLLCLSLIHI